MHIISKRALQEFWEEHADATAYLQTWFHHVKQAKWEKPSDIQKEFGDDVILPDNRAVFNIKGNDYRLVVRINYRTKTVYIRFVGTHAAYNRIDATTI